MDRGKHIVCVVGARALATVQKCRLDLRRILVVPVCWIAKFSIMLGVGSYQRSGPAPLRDVISIYQRLKSGAEFDQFGVKVLGGYSWSDYNDRKRGDCIDERPLQTCLWVACYARCQPEAWKLSPFMAWVRAGAEVGSFPSACF